MFLSSPPSPYLNSNPRIQMKLILGCNRMNIMHIVNCSWIPLVIMIHGLAYTHYWYAPYFIELWTATSVHLEAVVAHQMLEDSSIPSMLILLLMIECCWKVSRWLTCGQQWTFRIMTYYHHYHHYYHRDDGVTAKVHYRTFNVWGNHGSNERILWQCYGDIHGRILWH